MSTSPQPPEQFTLLGTDDAMVWAEEFCRIFNGYTITAEPDLETVNSLDPGTMVGWFANAMTTAVNLYERKKLNAKEEQQEAFMEGFQEGRVDT